MKSKKEFYWDIRPRIFIMMLLLMILLFVSIYISFNTFIKSYIESQVNTQLYNFTQNPTTQKPKDIPIPDMTNQPHSKFGFKAEVFVINNNYEVIHFNNKNDLKNGLIISKYLKENDINPKNINNLNIKLGDEEFYITSKPDEKYKEGSLIFYVDVSSISNFAKTINYALVIIILVGIFLSFIISILIANSVTKPVKQLSSYAKEIGKGNFESRSFNFKDREFAGLAKVMNKSAKQLSKYDSEQKIFFQNVSHELRSPLMSIKCYAEGIQHGLMDKEASSEIIISETDRLTELVEDLLYISRIDNITKDLVLEKGDLRETLSLSMESQKSISASKNITIEYDFDDNPVFFDYSEKYMYRAFYNVISNGIQFAKSKIILFCKTINDEIIISIKNDGAIIKEKDISHIFERFYKGEEGKTGIGLSIVKSVIESHNGTIEVNSDGITEFKIIFNKSKKET